MFLWLSPAQLTHCCPCQRAFPWGHVLVPSKVCSPGLPAQCPALFGSQPLPAALEKLFLPCSEGHRPPWGCLCFTHGCQCHSNHWGPPHTNPNTWNKLSGHHFHNASVILGHLAWRSFLHSSQGMVLRLLKAAWRMLSIRETHCTLQHPPLLRWKLPVDSSVLREK